LNLVIWNIGKIDYLSALELQKELAEKRQMGVIGDTLLLVEHPPVITLGTRGKYSNIKVSSEILKENNVSIHEVSRGGDVTYHGPGQIVGYPIFDLKEHGRDIKQFIWNIEEVFIRLLKEEFNITAHREEKEYTGVWVKKDKITAIGIAVKKWITMHGFAFNVNTNLDHFKWIVPCGLAERGVTSLASLLGKPVDYEKLIDMTADYFCNVFNMVRSDYNAD
jgi:lipoyl(octanoyl) transferase